MVQHRTFNLSRAWGSAPSASTPAAHTCINTFLAKTVTIYTKINRSGFAAKWLCSKLEGKRFCFQSFLNFGVTDNGLWVYRCYFIKKIQKLKLTECCML